MLLLLHLHPLSTGLLLQVMTPNIYNFDLWKISGHADHYRCVPLHSQHSSH